MQLRTLLLLLVLAAVAAFAALNWGAIAAPTTLSLGFAAIEAPLGLIMLALIVVLTTVFLLFVVYLQTTVLLDARRNARELRSQRELADQAEASRFSQLHTFLEEELRKIEERDAAALERMLARTEQLERELRTAVETAGNTLAAYIGELEDRLEGGRGTRA
ncbi:MAG: LapA family protein [Pseudomonadota bacterium]|jgi:biopolymer transport protein ExbB/TolQ